MIDMWKQVTQEAVNNQKEDSFDGLMANLMVLITHHSLTQCEGSLKPIVEHLHNLCQHSELEYYPEQMHVLAKMQRLWKTKLLDIELSVLKH